MLTLGEELMNRLYARLAGSASLASKLQGSIKFLIHGPGGGVWILRGGETPQMQAGAGHADCTVECSYETLNSICSGVENPQVAFLRNDLIVRGNTDLALNLVHLWKTSF